PYLPSNPTRPQDPTRPNDPRPNRPWGPTRSPTRLLVRVKEAGRSDGLRGARVRLHFGGGLGAGGGPGMPGGWGRQAPGPGPCTISAEAQGFEPKQENFQLQPGFNQATITLKRAAPPRRRTWTMNVLVREAGKRNTVPIAGATVRVTRNGQTVA